MHISGRNVEAWLSDPALTGSNFSLLLCYWQPPSDSRFNRDDQLCPWCDGILAAQTVETILKAVWHFHKRIEAPALLETVTPLCKADEEPGRSGFACSSLPLPV
jgi:hypothetical protein